MERRWCLSADTRAVRKARHVCRDFLEPRIERSRLTDDAVLVVSELVTNAVVHGCPPIELMVSITSVEVRLEVADEGRGPDEWFVPFDRPGSRGLAIVDAVSEQWGVRQTASGKVVWSVVLR